MKQTVTKQCLDSRTLAIVSSRGGELRITESTCIPLLLPGRHLWVLEIGGLARYKNHLFSSSPSFPTKRSEHRCKCGDLCFPNNISLQDGLMLYSRIKLTGDMARVNRTDKLTWSAVCSSEIWQVDSSSANVLVALDLAVYVFYIKILQSIKSVMKLIVPCLLYSRQIMLEQKSVRYLYRWIRLEQYVHEIPLLSKLNIRIERCSIFFCQD